MSSNTMSSFEFRTFKSLYNSRIKNKILTKPVGAVKSHKALCQNCIKNTDRLKTFLFKDIKTRKFRH